MELANRQDNQELFFAFAKAFRTSDIFAFADSAIGICRIVVATVHYFGTLIDMLSSWTLHNQSETCCYKET